RPEPAVPGCCRIRVDDDRRIRRRFVMMVPSSRSVSVVGQRPTRLARLPGGFTMSERSTPRAPRIQRPSWRDSRLLVGILIVLATVAAVSYLIARADDRVPMYT